MNSKIVLVSRVLLGLVMLVFGLNGLMMFTLGNGFIPAPPPTGDMSTVFAGFMATKYLMILVKILEVIAGVLLLWGSFLNLAIILLGPIMVNIFFIHLFVDRSGLIPSIIFCALYVVIVKSRWEDFKIALKK